MANRIQLRRDTAANWASVNPVLAQGEPGHEIGTGVFKLGDGVTAWVGLPDAARAYADAAVAALVDSSPAALDTLNELAAALGNDPDFATTVNAAIAARLTEAQGDARYRLAATLIGLADLGFDPATQGELDTAILTRAPVGALDAETAARIAADNLRALLTDPRFARPSPSVVYLGDSLTARGNQFDVAGVSRDGVGYVVWSQVLMGERLAGIYNAGIAGERLAQMAARLQADVLSKQPGVCVLLGGINDIQLAGPTSLASMQATVTSMLDQLQAAGIFAVVCTIPPSNLLDTAAEKAQFYAYNRWLSGLPSTRRGVAVANLWAAVADPAAGTLWAAGLAQDGVHQNGRGAAFMAQALASVLNPLFPPKRVETHIDDPNELAPNPRFTGNAAGLATSVIQVGGTASKVARTDGVLGEWQQLVLAPSLTHQLLQDSQAAKGWQVGESVYATFEVETDPNWTGVTVHYYRLEARNAANAILANVASLYDVTHTNQPRLASGIVRTNPIVIPANTTYIRLGAQVATDATGAGTMRFGTFSLRRVGT